MVLFSAPWAAGLKASTPNEIAATKSTSDVRILRDVLISKSLLMG